MPGPGLGAKEMVKRCNNQCNVGKVLEGPSVPGVNPLIARSIHAQRVLGEGPGNLGSGGIRGLRAVAVSHTGVSISIFSEPTWPF